MRHFKRVRKHGGWILLSLAAFVAIRRFVPEAMLQGVTNVGGNFLQTFGGMYGVIVAFAIYVTWGQHNETQVAVEREAVTLAQLYRVLGWFPSWAERKTVRDRLLGYARAVPLANGDPNQSALASDHQLLDQSLAVFMRHTPTTPAEERLHGTALDLFHDLNVAREHRITVSNLRLPEGLRWFVFIGGAITIVSMELLWVDSIVMQGVLVSFLTWVIVAAASIMIDLDDPYTGDFQVDWNRFHETARLMEETHCTA